MRGSIDSIETLGLVDGPGIRCVVFLNGCNLRCKYCHNPEMWCLKENNYTVDELVDKIKRYKPYFNENGGVTFSGGEPLLQINFLKEVMKKLKKENINICLDTAGYSKEDYTEIIPKREYTAQGSAKINDLNDSIGLHMESDDYESIGGYLIEHLDHLPVLGEYFITERGVKLVVEELKKNRIELVHIYIPEDYYDSKDDNE